MIQSFHRKPAIDGSLIFFCVALLTGCGQTEEKAIEASFKNYQSALQKKDGEAAAKVVTRQSIEEYAQLLEHVQKSDEAEVRKMGLWEKLMVLQVRHRATPQQLRSLKSPDFFDFMVRQGWAGGEEVAGIKLEEIVATADAAKAGVLLNGKPTPTLYHFRREGGVWKIDLSANAARAEELLLKNLKNKPLSADDYIIQALEWRTGSKASTNIWKPTGAN